MSTFKFMRLGALLTFGASLMIAGAAEAESGTAAYSSAPIVGDTMNSDFGMHAGWRHRGHRVAMCRAGTATIVRPRGEARQCVRPDKRTFAHSGLKKRHAPAVARRETAEPIIVAGNYGSHATQRFDGATLQCTGSASFSMLCPGAQVIGGNY